MNKWKISKSFDFDYAHRVHNQVLNTCLSLDNLTKCKSIHGHFGQLIVQLEGTILNEQSMVFDYKNLNFIKRFIDEELDHKWILDVEDPYLENIFLPLPFIYKANLAKKHITSLTEPAFENHKHNYWTPRILEGVKDYEADVLKGIILVPFVPTSERLAQWVFSICKTELEKFKVTVSSVTFKETPKTSAEFSITN
jgi:6-pyruvoyltetrahydropterin/6-carboxytetrahydropterin synthase